MFSKLTIDNYRGIRHAEIDGLTQVNIFFGKNNCGKSSVLEAVFLLCDQSNPMLTVRLNTMRGLQRLSRSAIEANFYNCSPDNNIHISGDGGTTRALSISTTVDDIGVITIADMSADRGNTNMFLYGLRHSFRLADKSVTYRSQLILPNHDEDHGKVMTDKSYNETLRCKYLPSRVLQVSAFDQYKNIVINKREKEIEKAMRIVEPRLADIIYSSDNLAADVGMSKRLPIAVLGDGFTKTLALVLAIHECENGVLLIDEIENGLHHSVLEKCWKIILATAREHNVQLFITTHSIDVLKGLAEALNDNDIDRYASQVSAYKLIRMDDDELAALRYDSKKLTYCLEQEIEIR